MAKDVLNKRSLDEESERIINETLNGKVKELGRFFILYEKVCNYVNIDRVIFTGIYNVIGRVIVSLIPNCPLVFEIDIGIPSPYDDVLGFFTDWILFYWLTKLCVSDSEIKLHLFLLRQLFGIK
ncbi:MAG: hypothetical protein AB7D09_08870 [Methanosarcina sp.]